MTTSTPAPSSPPTSLRSRLRARRSHGALTNPVLLADELPLVVGAERAERARQEPGSVDLLVWNTFATLDRHADGDWLAHRIQLLGGPQVRPPVRMSLFSGRTTEPLLRPSRAYVQHVQQRASGEGTTAQDLSALQAPIEVPVRIETPDVLVLVDAAGRTPPRGAAGRDRILELVDAGLEHAQRLDKQLAVAAIYPAGTAAAAEVSARMNALRDPAHLQAEMPYRPGIGARGDVVLRELSWQQLLALWEAEVPYLGLSGQPVKAFLQHCRDRGLR